MINPNQFHYLTFDCYGTLIDWERGILGAARPILQAHGVSLPDAQILERYGRYEGQIEAGPFLRYRQVLKECLIKFGESLGFVASEEEQTAFAESIRRWSPFPDTTDALRRLQEKYKLVILSNVDDEFFSASARQMGIFFDIIVTAQQCRSYKPSYNNFHTALERIGAPKEQVLHVAQSLFHDHQPAKQLGFTTAWVNRSGAKMGVGIDVKPDLEVPDMKTLADRLCAGG